MKSYLDRLLEEAAKKRGFSVNLRKHRPDGSPMTKPSIETRKQRRRRREHS
jgi:hypothetical protein